MTGAPAMPLLDRLGDAYGAALDALFMRVVEPALQVLGLAAYLADGYAAANWLGAGLLQVLLLLVVLAPLERLRPFERPATAGMARAERRQAVAVDVIYTLIDRLGLLRLVLFFTTDPLWNALFGRLAVAGFDGWHLDQWIAPWWPGLTDTALAGFLAYVVVLDAAGYLVHRAQHALPWWWALHAVHHSQRHMTVWTDSRQHLLDTLVVDALLVMLARVIGVAPDQFVALVALSKLVESLSHANLDLPFGRLGERLLVGPRFHRVHHGMDTPVHPASARVHGPGNCNFGVLLPLWDVLARTARFDLVPGPTGIADQLPAAGQHDYGRGFWAQQRLGLRRLREALQVRPTLR